MKRKAVLFFAVLMLFCVCSLFSVAAQLDTAAYAVLYRGGEVWETRVVSVQQIPDQILLASPCEPEIVVTYEETLLFEETDYTVDYSENDHPGLAFARVTFRGDYFGYIDVPFTIVSNEVLLPAVQPVPDQRYAGEAIEPELPVTLGETVLTRGLDYTASFSNNVGVGTADVLISLFTGGEEQTLSAQFAILPRDASEISVEELPVQNYTGDEVRPELVFSFGGILLEEGFDYDLTYSDNVAPGAAAATAVFFGNFTGERVICFTIAFGAQVEFSAEPVSDSVFLRWSAPYGATSYKLYRFDNEVGRYVLLCHTKLNEFEDKKLTELQTYQYKLVCYGKTDSGTLRSQGHKATASVGLKTPNLAIKTLNKKIKLAWTKNPLADGYLVYRFDPSTGKQKKLAKIKDISVRTYLDKTVINGAHYQYFVRSYKKIDGKNLFSAFSDRKDPLAPASLLAGLKKRPLTSYPIYNVQGSGTRYLSSVTLSKNDLEILDVFAKEHFMPGWSDEQKLRYTLEWINSEVYYPFGKVFEEICQYSHTKAIFECKKGQCLQYNGAMCAMMTYLGYPSRLIMGYRGTYGVNHFQHFWCETVINETVFVLETGNAGRSGSWMYFFRPYSETFGYIKNRKNVS